MKLTKINWLTVWALALLFLIPVYSQLHAQNISDVLGVTSDEPSDTGPTEISAEVDPNSDREIEKRLIGIFSELEQYSGIDVSVSNSVVTLQGKLLSANAIADAKTLAAKVKGVVEVDNRLTVTTAVSDRLDNSIDELTQDSRQFLGNLPMLLLAMAIIVASWFLGRRISLKRALFLKITPNNFIAELLGNIVWIIIFILGLYLGLRLLDATKLIGTVLGAAGIVGLAVGFAVRDTVENYIASVLLSLRNPFKTKDYIAIGDVEGSVARLTSRATILVSAEGNHVRIPNSIVYKSIITNYSRNPLRRFDFTIGIDSSDDILLVQKLSLEIIDNVNGVLSDPSCAITVDKIGDSNITLRIQAWVDQSEYDLLKVRSETIRQLKIGLDNANIIMPEPIYQLKISTQNLPSAVAPIVESAKSKAKAKATNESQVKQQPHGGSSIPAQSVNAEDTIDKTIDAELKISDENLLSEDTAHE